MVILLSICITSYILKNIRSILVETRSIWYLKIISVLKREYLSENLMTICTSSCFKSILYGVRLLNFERVNDWLWLYADAYLWRITLKIPEHILKIILFKYWTISLTIYLLSLENWHFNSVGISMGTDCAPLLADFVCSHETAFIQNFLKDKKKRHLRNSLIFLLDILMICNHLIFDIQYWLRWTTLH